MLRVRMFAFFVYWLFILLRPFGKKILLLRRAAALKSAVVQQTYKGITFVESKNEL